MYKYYDNPRNKEFKNYPNPFWVLLMLAAVVVFVYLGYQIPHQIHR